MELISCQNITNKRSFYKCAAIPANANHDLQTNVFSFSNTIFSKTYFSNKYSMTYK